MTAVVYHARTYLSLPLDLLRSRARYSQAGATSEAAAFILPGGLCCKLLIVVSCRTMGARQEALPHEFAALPGRRRHQDSTNAPLRALLKKKRAARTQADAIPYGGSHVAPQEIDQQ